MVLQKLRCLNFGRGVAHTFVFCVACGIGVVGCRETGSKGSGTSSQAPIPSVTRLPAELGAQVLAKVGDRTITLADYALVLDRMDRIERLRYQTPERRRALLDEIINSELLAAEAVRRGLDKDPATLEYIDQLFRDELRRRLRAEIPPADSLPIEDVQAYYAAHRDEFRTPEMRRVAAIVLPNEAAATKLLAELGTKPSVTQWNTAAIRHSVDSRESGLPVEVLGDMGLITSTSVGPKDPAVTPRENQGDGSSRVPAEVRSAAFALQLPGEVFPRPVLADATVYLVRLLAINPARLRSQEEVEQEVRNRLVDQRLDARLAELERELSDNGVVNTGSTGEGK